jgi:RTX calcium-binding nonapeptide repeat (4 copies)
MFNPPISARRLVLIGAALVSMLVLAPWASATRGNAAPVADGQAMAPSNDAFAAAHLLGGTEGDLAATSKDATKEVGEPAHAGTPGGASVWFRITPNRTGRMTVLTRQISFDTVLSVYTGASVDALTEIASNNDHGTSDASRVAFPVVPGTTYFIAVDGDDGGSGPFILRWRQGPQNDDFADASLLEGASGSVEGTVYGATSEPGEQIHDAGATAWYRWLAPEDGEFGFLLEGARVATVYSGASVGALTPLGSGWLVTFPAVAGTEYSVAVESNWNDSFRFELIWARTPANDDFAGAQVIAGRSGTVAGTDVLATMEPDEPDFCGGDNTVWYTWTAPRSEDVRFEIDVDTLTHDTVLSVWAGASVDALRLVRQDDQFFGDASALSFIAAAGTTYHVRVSGFCGNMGEFDLDWYPGAIILGTARNNIINGTAGRDYINGRDGRDVIRGGAGGDTLIGGSGPDTLGGGSGNDLLISRDGVRGNDVVFGGPGRDTVERDRRDEVHQVP